MAIIKRLRNDATDVDDTKLEDIEINILHMYPQEMNIYGDIGNVTCLKKRIAWRGIKANVYQLHLNGKFTDEKGNILERDQLPKLKIEDTGSIRDSQDDIRRFDIYFMGGGQDLDQADVYMDLLKYTQGIKDAVENNKVFLLICGGYQLFGRTFLTVGGKKINGLGILDEDTVGGDTRCIGNIVIKSTLPDLKDTILVGFENHSGRTKLLSNKVKVIGDVLYGVGNDENGGKEGGYYKNVYGCYLHGSFLPKNPEFADLLIRKAIENKYGEGKVNLPDLDDYIEKYARDKIVKKYSK